MKKSALFLLVVLLLFVVACSVTPDSVSEEVNRTEIVANLVAASTANHVVVVAEDGSFSPQEITVNGGETVEWIFYDDTYSVVPVSLGADVCSSYNSFDESVVNDFTGPMPRLASGIFVLGPQKDNGFEVGSINNDQTCIKEDGAPEVGSLYLCQTAEKYTVLDETWNNPEVDGVYLRYDWNDVHLGPDLYDWSAVDREIQKAVDSGKVYSLSYRAGKHGTPKWIFENGVERLSFQDGGDEVVRSETACGSRMDLGNPTDPKYQEYYFEIIEATAAHIKEKNAWYRSLAYYKPSGANLFTHENRLPKSCKEGCVCNTQVFSEGGYTSEGLYEFYEKQTAVIVESFPDKDMSYMLIQAGFPLVDAQGVYGEEVDLNGAEQTVTILAKARKKYGERFVVQHNGLRPKPRGCPNEGKHPVEGPLEYAGSGCPNRYVLTEGIEGQPTALQTINAKNGVDDTKSVEKTLDNAIDNSDALFIELYEERVWEAYESGDLKVSLEKWGDLFHERRNQDWEGDPYPDTYSFTFASEEEVINYVNPSNCVGSYGTVIVSS
jgi:plastocyanin